MTKKAKATKRNERGLNVKVTQEKKTTEHNGARINRRCNEEDSAAKTTVNKKAIEEKAPEAEIKEEIVEEIKEESKNESNEKTTEKEAIVESKKEETKAESVEEVKQEEVKQEEPKCEFETETKSPASFSKNVAPAEEVKAPEVILPTEEEEIKEEAVKKDIVEEAIKEESVENASIKNEQPTIEQPTSEQVNFETLTLNTNSTYTSRILPRDVTRNRADVENLVVKDFKIEPVKKAKPVQTLPQTEKRVARPTKLSAKEIKEREIKKIINTASHLPKTSKKSGRKFNIFSNLGWARTTLMITCVATAVFAMVYFINLSSVDMSLKVAAAQSGIDATYPNYVPRGYALSDVTSASGKVTMNFKGDNGVFTITEESSGWDSNALLNNYIRNNYADDEYSVIIEQGLMIYMGSDWEAWVNGGLLYKLNVKSGSLTKKQMKTIATSL